MWRWIKVGLLVLGGMLVGGAVVFTWALVLVMREGTAEEQCHAISYNLARILEKRSDGVPSQTEIDEMLRSLAGPGGKLIVRGQRGLPVDVWHSEFKVRVVAGKRPGTLELTVQSAGSDGIMDSRDDHVVKRTLESGAR